LFNPVLLFTELETALEIIAEEFFKEIPDDSKFSAIENPTSKRLLAVFDKFVTELLILPLIKPAEELNDPDVPLNAAI
jgi:uncharacterized protein with ParB-like and HNH nuclease domain